MAQAVGGKAAAMGPPAMAEKLTGYHVGAISPFGQKRPVATAIEAGVIGAERVWINAGRRGLLLAIAPRAALALLGVIAAVLIA